jgi:hypothetical protein
MTLMVMKKIHVKRGRKSSLAQWKPRTNENRMLQKYWLKVGGRIYTEVPIGGPGGKGNWPQGSARRWIDGVRLPSKGNQRGILDFRRVREDFIKQINGRAVELIEVKPKLNRPVIGQMIAAKVMFERQYKVAVDGQVVLCHGGDPALEWVCRRIGIEVRRV